MSVHVSIESASVLCAVKEKSYVEVLGVNIWVLWEVVVLLGHEHTLLEEVLVDLLSVSLWDKPETSSVNIWPGSVCDVHFGDCEAV